jgi:hypothetical protein
VLLLVSSLLSKTESGKAFLANVDSAVEGVKEAVVDGYRTRDAEIRKSK